MITQENLKKILNCDLDYLNGVKAALNDLTLDENNKNILKKSFENIDWSWLSLSKYMNKKTEKKNEKALKKEQLKKKAHDESEKLQEDIELKQKEKMDEIAKKINKNKKNIKKQKIKQALINSKIKKEPSEIVEEEHKLGEKNDFMDKPIKLEKPQYDKWQLWGYYAWINDGVNTLKKLYEWLIQKSNVKSVNLEDLNISKKNIPEFVNFFLNLSKVEQQEIDKHAEIVNEIEDLQKFIDSAKKNKIIMKQQLKNEAKDKKELEKIKLDIKTYDNVSEMLNDEKD